jgi:predicted NAD/FAD-dependent oxidoreductase
MKKVAIIGAGVAGLTAASKLNAVADVEVFEKSWRAGGRMTSREKAYAFDHGAQYFTARSNAFKAFIEPFIQRGIIEPWLARFVEYNRRTVSSRRMWDSKFPHYVAVPGMNALCLALAAELNVRYETRVVSVQAEGSCWQLKDSDDALLGSYDWVITAVPAEQAIELMPDCFKHIQSIRQKKMLACYTLMLGFKRGFNIGFDAALITNADISWISVNSSKPGRPSDFTLLVHSSNAWAEDNIDMQDVYVMQHLITELCDVIEQDVSAADYVDLHRWRYANIAKQKGDKALIDQSNRLAAIGDWCIQGRVEEAFISGNSLAIG